MISAFRLPRPAILLALAVSACGSGGGSGKANFPGDSRSTEPFSGIALDETLHFTGTEPFWGGEVRRDSLIYTTPENPAGATVPVSRFAGRNGISFGGTLEGQDFTMAISPGRCSDGMSDRTYPFHVTLRVKGETRSGCAWSDRHPLTGSSKP